MEAQRAEGERGRETKEGEREKTDELKWGGGAGGISLESTSSCIMDAVSCTSSYMVANAAFVQSNQLNKQRQHNLGGILQKKLQTCQVNFKG